MRANALYDAACAYALKGKPDDALDHLKQAVDAGFKNRGHIEADADLASLRGDATRGTRSWRRRSERADVGGRVEVA